MSRCLAIFHKQLGDLVLLEPTLKRLARASDSSVDLITRSGFQPLISLMPHVNFRRQPASKAYETLWCFDDRKKSAFYSLGLPSAPEASFDQPRGAHSMVSPQDFPPDLWALPGEFSYCRILLEKYHGRWRPGISTARSCNPPLKSGPIHSVPRITCMSIPPPDGKVRIGRLRNGP